MEEFNNVGRLLIYIGLTVAALGGVIYLTGGRLNWLGHLPGDIRIEKENFTFYFPLTTMIIISIVFNLILRIIRLFLK